MAEYIIQGETLTNIADAIREYETAKSEVIALVTNRENITVLHVPSGLTSIPEFAFSSCPMLNFIYLPETLTSISPYAFDGCTNITTINVPWSEGAVAGAPWSATRATINYNYVG